VNDDTAPILSIRSLSYRYPSGQQALEDVSLELQPGERVAVVGPSGAGKSTLLLHLNGLLPEYLPAAGDASRNGAAGIRVQGQSVCRKHLPEIRRAVGFLFQDPDDQLFCPTVQEDVAFGPLNLELPRDVVEQRIREGLAAVGLSDYEGRSTLQLSVGERKRIALAGVLACRPAILALDEPSSNLDPRARRQIVNILRQLEATQVIATHDLDLVVELCTRAIVLDEGRIRADGPPRTVLADATLMDRHGLEVPLCLLCERQRGKPL